MKQEDVPKAESINMTPPDKDELDWTSTLMFMINKAEDNSIEAPFQEYPELAANMKFIVGTFIHEN